MEFAWIWGEKIVRKRLGRVADFCFICRQVAPCTFIRLGLAKHNNFIALTNGKLVGFERQCNQCRQTYSAEEEDYSAISRSHNADLNSLIAETNPSLESRIAPRLELEQRVRDRRLGTEERDALLIEPFHLVDPLMIDRDENFHCDRWTFIAIMTTIALIVASVAANIYSRNVMLVGLGVTVVAAIIGLFVFLGDSRRYLRGVIEPRLALALADLAPTMDDFERLQAKDKTVRRVARSVDLQRFIQHAESRG